MSFPRYPQYKDSGVDWLGPVPAHWEVVQFKQFVDIQNGADHKHVEQDDGYPVIGSGGAFTYASDFLYDGESVLLGRKGTIDKPLHVTGRFWTVDTMYWTKIRPNASGRFAYYTALTIPFGYYSTNTALPSMTKGALNAHFVARPPLPEQREIAGFLDRETAQIDALVAEQERLLELLKEKRQAVISHAVTRGLNPNAPLKPSGLAWLGDIPAHWDFGAIKHFVSAKNGAIKTGPFGSHLTADDMQAGSIKVYNQRSVIDQDFTSGENFISQAKFEELASFETFPGDLLVTTRGTIGRAAILPEDAERGILHPCLLRIQTDPRKLDVRFLERLIRDSDLLQSQLKYLSNSTTIDVIYSQTIAAVVIPVPPPDEQRAIVAHLDAVTAQFDALTAAVERALALLQERRTALISAAVTGQIDVRSATA